MNWHEILDFSKQMNIVVRLKLLILQIYGMLFDERLLELGYL
jgi:hypothetical protein